MESNSVGVGAILSHQFTLLERFVAMDEVRVLSVVVESCPLVFRHRTLLPFQTIHITVNSFLVSFMASNVTYIQIRHAAVNVIAPFEKVRGKVTADVVRQRTERNLHHEILQFKRPKASSQGVHSGLRMSKGNLELRIWFVAISVCSVDTALEK
jgi:hypothetical protein